MPIVVIRPMTKILDKDTKILIVDDNTMYVKVLTKMLQSGFGYQSIETVDSVKAGYETIKIGPDLGLIFVDFRFPSGETGADLLRKLQLEDLLKQKAVFLITSEPTVDNVKEARAAGAIGVVAKPFDREELKKQLEKGQRLVGGQEESF